MMYFFQQSIQKFIFVLCVVTSSFVLAEECESPPVALALGGGGFLSTTQMTGFTAGLLAYAIEKDGKNGSPPTLFDSKIFGNVESINSISGGSWYAAKLIYSSRYRYMTEKLALATSENQGIDYVSNIFKSKDSFTRLIDFKRSKIIREEVLDNLRFPLRLFLLVVVPEILNPAGKDILARVEDILALYDLVRDEAKKSGKPINWQSFVETFVLDDIAHCTFGHDVQEWAKGKNWRVIATAVTPKKDSPNWIYATPFIKNFLHYTIEHPEQLEIFHPVRFSAMLGYPEADADPYDTYTENLLSNMDVQYEGQDVKETFVIIKKDTDITSSVGIGLDNNRNFSKMPIAGPVSASSAFLGSFTVQQLPGLQISPRIIAETFGDSNFIDPNVYFAPRAAQETAFSDPTQIMKDIWKSKDPTKKRIQKLASIGTHALIDGGNVDLIGVATAVATGASDVFVLQIAGFWDMYFSDKNEVTHIFDQNKTTVCQARCNTFDTWGRNETYKILESITYGSVTGKTIDNKYYDIKGGENVTLHVFQANICNDLVKTKPSFDCTCECEKPQPQLPKKCNKEPINIGILDNYDNYSLLVAEIADAMYKNGSKVEEMLKILQSSSQTHKSDEL